MRVAGALVLITGACGGTIPDAKTHPARPSDGEQTSIDPLACPLAAIRASVAAREVESLAELRGALLGRTSSRYRRDATPLRRELRSATVVKTLSGSSTSYHALIALHGSYIVTGAVAESTEVTSTECGHEVDGAILGVRVIDGADGRVYGVVRARRRDVGDTPTLPTIVARRSSRGARCEVLASFRIEDHVFDLERARHVGGVAQTYRAPLYEEVEAPALAFDKLSLSKEGIAIDDARCKHVPLRRVAAR